VQVDYTGRRSATVAYKNMLLILDDAPACAERLRLASALAERFDAHLVGLLARTEPQIPAYVAAAIPPEVMLAQSQAIDTAVANIRQRFDHAVGAAGISGEWRQASGGVEAVATLHARYADLAIVGQTDADHLGDLGTAGDLPAHLALQSGRPVLVVPSVGRYDRIGRQVMIAWNGSREAARAVSDAMPFLQQAERVTVLAIDPHSGSEAGTHGDVPGADIALHLARHGVKADAAQVRAADVSVADMLLSRAADQEADLLVMGAYGQSRLRELVLGGVTRNILAHMTLPVLLSH
jgi:nucleotide-binding universal stress UspA family protein